MTQNQKTKILIMKQDTEPSDYKYGFTSDIDQDVIAPGITEETIRLISSKNNEPAWLLEFRLEAYHHWLKQKDNPPTWADLDIKPIDYDKISFYAGIKKLESKSLEEIKKGWIDKLKKD
jgi:Fe-S cluster assembly protein SufB